MSRKTVFELMHSLNEFPHIPYWFSLRQAMAEFDRAQAACTGAPDKRLPWLVLVFDAKNQLLGFVRRREIMQGLRPALLDKPIGNGDKLADLKSDPNLINLSFDYDKALAELRHQIERPIVEFMAPVDVTIDANDYVLQAIYLMIDRRVSYLPAVQDGAIVGMLYALDVLEEVTRLVI